MLSKHIQTFILQSHFILLLIHTFNTLTLSIYTFYSLTFYIFSFNHTFKLLLENKQLPQLRKYKTKG